jgi:hypothetical protein
VLIDDAANVLLNPIGRVSEVREDDDLLLVAGVASLTRAMRSSKPSVARTSFFRFSSASMIRSRFGVKLNVIPA